MQTMMKSLVLEQPNRLVLQERPVPTPGPNEVLIRLKAAGICHTDFLTIEGQFTGCKYPTVPGHEFSGVVEQCGSAVTHVDVGDHITCISFAYCGICMNCRRGLHHCCLDVRGIPFHMDGAYQQYMCVAEIMAYQFDQSLSFAEAALTEPAANGYAAAERAGIRPGERVVIVGPGPIGLLALQAAKLYVPGTLTMLGTRLERLQLAEKLGATAAANVREADPYEAVMDITDGYGADVVIFCGGQEDAWKLAARLLAKNGRVVVEALPGRSDDWWPVPVFDFTAKNISYLGVCGYNGEQFGRTLQLMQSGQIDAASLITHKFALEDYKEAFETSEKRKSGAIKVCFEMNKD